MMSNLSYKVYKTFIKFDVIKWIDDISIDK